MPYWMLLPVQLVMIVGMLWIVRDFACGSGFFVGLKARTGMILMVLGAIYAGTMVVRYVATMWLHPELRWLTGTIPIWFHLVLATFIVTLGHYPVWRCAPSLIASAHAVRPAPSHLDPHLRARRLRHPDCALHAAARRHPPGGVWRRGRARPRNDHVRRRPPSIRRLPAESAGTEPDDPGAHSVHQHVPQRPFGRCGRPLLGEPRPYRGAAGHARAFQVGRHVLSVAPRAPRWPRDAPMARAPAMVRRPPRHVGRLGLRSYPMGAGRPKHVGAKRADDPDRQHQLPRDVPRRRRILAGVGIVLGGAQRRAGRRRSGLPGSGTRLRRISADRD